MCRQYLRTALLAAFAFASPLPAQITLPGGVIAAILEPQSYTTGMVGFTTNQTARLVVLIRSNARYAECQGKVEMCTCKGQ
jgi:hypothetical protein